MTRAATKLADNLARVRERMDRAAKRAGRRGDEITLIAVSKTHSATQIEEMYAAGVCHFGENRVQERESKQLAIANLDVTWHMLGHVQRNKAAKAVQLFHSIDSLDSLALAERLDRAKAELTGDHAAAAGLANARDFSSPRDRLRVLIEVKLDPEPVKSGVPYEEVPRLAAALLKLRHLNLRGLMAIPPYFDDPEDARPYFRRLRQLRDELHLQFGAEVMTTLSMGMSHDFEIAIEEGATEIRVGTALFGEREKA